MYSQKELTSLLYYSPQSSFFIAGSIRDNLKYGLKNEVSDNELVAALEKVRLYGNYEGVIAEKPEDALEISISEGAKELSGGMKQRLALARAFLRKIGIMRVNDGVFTNGLSLSRMKIASIM